MLDPRIYRAAFLPILFALVLVAFSLRDQPRGEPSTLAPAAFDGEAAFRQLDRLAAAAPARAPGSPGDALVAERVRAGLEASGFAVRTRRFEAQTSDGARDVEAVVGERVGFSSRRIVVVAQRDAVGAGARAQLSGTAGLLELARVLGGRTLERTLVLASVSGGPEASAWLAENAGGPVDAVLVLGDLAGTRTTQPVVVPWGDGATTAPLELRRTVETAVAAEARLRPGRPSPAGQFARLAFPLTTGAQGPFVGAGVPAVLLSASGERAPAPAAPVSAERLEAFGRAALRSVSALDAARDVPAPSAYVTIERKLLPAWPIRLLAIALMLPVLVAAVDGFARVRRRGEPVGRWLRWLAACALPFALAVLLARALRLTGLLEAAPASGGTAFPVDAVPRDGTALAALASVLVVVALGWFALRPLAVRLAGAKGDPASPGAAAAVLIVLCAVALVAWVLNPYASLLLVPALHLWLLAIAPEVRLHPVGALALFALGLVPPLLVAASYASQLGLGPLELAWTGLLCVAGGGVGLLPALAWAVVLGCAGAVLVIVVRTAGGGPAAERGVTVRGPRSYAGPGSLGGTESALRR